LSLLRRGLKYPLKEAKQEKTVSAINYWNTQSNHNNRPACPAAAASSGATPVQYQPHSQARGLVTHLQMNHLLKCPATFFNDDAYSSMRTRILDSSVMVVVLLLLLLLLLLRLAWFL
jgi:hypothetical protein